MAKLVAISGTHGCGKSTVLNEVRAKLPKNFAIDDFKASREVQASLGIDLQTALTDLTSLVAFQEKVFEVKVKNDMELLRRCDTEIILVERSFLDLICYTQLWLQHLDLEQTHLEWFNVYTKKALKFQRLYAATIFIPSSPEIPFIVDPNRGGEDTRLRFEFLLRMELSMFETMFQKESFYIPREMHPIDDRVDLVLDFLKQIQKITL